MRKTAAQKKEPSKALVPAKARKVDGRKNNRGVIGNKGGGRKAWAPKKKLIDTGKVDPETGSKLKREETIGEAWEREREWVQHHVAIGYPRDVIARLVTPPCDLSTLEKHFAFELENGKLLRDGALTHQLYSQAMKGDAYLMRFWARARMGWRDTGEIKVPAGAVQYQLIEGDDW